MRHAERQICEASDAGADALLVVTPTTLVRGRRESVVGYFESVADMSPLPVFLYTVPRVTGYELPCESVAELAGHHNIIGMKDSGGDTTRLDAIAQIMDESFIVYVGSSRVLTDSVIRGAYGAITASANYAFATVSGAIACDADAQDHLASLVSVVEPHGVPGTKFAASLIGMTPGPARRPLPAVSEDAKAEIRAAVGVHRKS
jgi:dihydrodipicolinate synthase/N-acetylneuraminate lyase